MSTVPNRYYNSPWIADAGRNLASALAPPDPDVLRQREQNAWQFRYMQDKAQNEATDRANSEEASAALGDMYELQRNPIIGADGKVDVKATEKRAFELADIAMTKGKKDVRADVDEGLFNLSPTFARKRILQRNLLTAQDDRLTRSLAGAMDLVNRRGEISGGLQDDDQEFELRKMREQFALRGNEWQQRALLAAKKANQPPITITPALADRIQSEMLRREKATGHRMTDEDRYAFISEAAEVTQTLRNPVTAVQELWNSKFPQATYTEAPVENVERSPSFDNWFGVDETRLAPQETPAAAPTSEAPRDFGTAATTPPVNPFLARGQAEAEMEAASRAAAAAENARLPVPGQKPAASAPTRRPPNVPKSAGRKPPEGARSKDKNGKPTIYRNGRWEYL